MRGGIVSWTAIRSIFLNILIHVGEKNFETDPKFTAHKVLESRMNWSRYGKARSDANCCLFKKAICTFSSLSRMYCSKAAGATPRPPLADRDGANHVYPVHVKVVVQRLFQFAACMRFCVTTRKSVNAPAHLSRINATGSLIQTDEQIFYRKVLAGRGRKARVYPTNKLAHFLLKQ